MVNLFSFSFAEPKARCTNSNHAGCVWRGGGYNWKILQRLQGEYITFHDAFIIIKKYQHWYMRNFFTGSQSEEQPSMRPRTLKTVLGILREVCRSSQRKRGERSSESYFTWKETGRKSLIWWKIAQVPLLVSEVGFRSNVNVDIGFGWRVFVFLDGRCELEIVISRTCILARVYEGTRGKI